MTLDWRRFAAAARMPRTATVVLIAVASMLAACSTRPAVEPERAVRERAEAYWAARVIGDHVTAYEYEAVSVGPDASLQRYLNARGTMAYERASVEEVRLVSPDKAEVRVAFAYRLPLPGMRRPIDAEAWTDWVMIDGKWYHSPRPSVMWQSR